MFVIVSSRSDVLKFCCNAVGANSILKVVDKPSEEIFYQACLYIIDANYLSLASESFLQNLKSNNIASLTIVPFDTRANIRVLAESMSPYSVPYPITEEYFARFLCKVLEKTLISEKHLKNKDVKSVPDSVLGFFRGNSEAMKVVRAKIQRAAGLNTPVLLLGETGSGKSTAAGIIHKLSNRSRNKFEQINISTISDTLAASTLFGTEDGAFTGAIKSEGLFRKTNGGTLLLDEIGMASQALQAMLLTVIENGIIQKVGSNVSEKVDVRVICATNANIKLMLEDGSFRSDLYYRICDTVIQIPPLRERPEDLIMLAEEYAKKNKRTLADCTLRAIETYHWPGNIRELHKCLKKAFDDCPNEEVTSDYLEFGLLD
ncbi:MAG: sigma 54-interacting transcriptional regulator [Treponema sp.]|nr:sigma 54-interacting transcriptional regulator [Treponema sp.]